MRYIVKRRRFGLTTALGLGGLATVLLAGNVVAAGDSPFTAMAGQWSGGGQLKLEGGKSEKLNCRAIYNPKDNGAHMGLSLRCASPSYNIELRSTLQYDAGKVSGSWEERTFNANGAVTGRASAGSLQLSFSGNVSGSMTVATTGSSQRVSLTTSAGGLSGLSLSLSKG